MAQAVDERIWRLEGLEKKRAAVRRMFSDIAPTYDRLNGILSLSLHTRWRDRAVEMLNLKPGNRALDVCCGTGDFLTSVRRDIGPNGQAVGVDFSSPMLASAAKKVQSAGLAQGDACRLPVQDRIFDGVTVGWGIRNVADIDEAHREIFRVLRPGGRFVSLDMAKPRSPFIRRVSSLVSRSILPRLGSIFGHRGAYAYLAESTQVFRSREELAASMSSAGLVDVSTHDLMFGNLCIHYGRRPERGDFQ